MSDMDPSGFVALPVFGLVVICACIGNFYYWRRRDQEQQSLLQPLRREEEPSHVVIDIRKPSSVSSIGTPGSTPIPSAPPGPVVSLYTIIEDPIVPGSYSPRPQRKN